jgi:hypothetical protein
VEGQNCGFQKVQVYVDVELDHDGNKQNKLVNIVCLPQ